jgi:hypothetical protein
MKIFIIMLLLLVFADAYGDNPPAETSGIKDVPSVTAMAGEQIKWQVLSSGGNRGTSASYVISGTVGQTAAGKGTSTNYAINQGYWQNFAPASCCDKPGDANNNGLINIQDVTYLINFLYKGGPASPCPEEGNANGLSVVNIQDVTYLINFLYKSGPAPKCP